MQAGLAKMRDRLKQHQDIARVDRGKPSSIAVEPPSVAPRPSSAPGTPRGLLKERNDSGGHTSTSESSDTSALQKIRVKDAADKFRKNLAGDRELALKTIEGYDDAAKLRLPNDRRIRIAPDLVPIIYKKGSAMEFVEKFVEKKHLEGSSYEERLRSAALSLDSELRDERGDIINSATGEQACSTIYAHMRALETVLRREDWQQPKGQKEGRWRSKVNNKLLKKLDLLALESSSESIPEVDDLIGEKLRRDAMLAKWLEKAPEGDPLATK